MMVQQHASVARPQSALHVAGWIGRGLVVLAAALALLLAPARVAHAQGAAPAPALSPLPAELPDAMTAARTLSAPPVAVRMDDVSARHGLVREHVHVLSGRARYGDGRNQVILAPGAYEVLVNGRALTLERPVACYRGDLIIPKDALAAIERLLLPKAPPPAPEPVAAPAPTPAPAAQRTPAPGAATIEPSARPGTIVIDAGHGGKFTGAKGASGLYEKEVNLAVVKHMKALLEAKGWRVTLTRDADESVRPGLNDDLEARIAVANTAGSDLFVSVHANHAASRSVDGFEVYYYAPSKTSAALARAIRAGLRSRIDDDDRGVKTAGFRVLRLARVPAALVEVGFLSHKETEVRLADDGYRRELAAAIVAGIERFHASR